MTSSAEVVAHPEAEEGAVGQPEAAALQTIESARMVAEAGAALAR